jgi:hypothetical protein
MHIVVIQHDNVARTLRKERHGERHADQKRNKFSHAFPEE